MKLLSSRFFHTIRIGSFSRSIQRDSRSIASKVLFSTIPLVLIVFSIAAADTQQSRKLRSLETVLTGGPYSFPEKITRDRSGNLYILDSELSNVFVLAPQRRPARVTPLCSPRTPVTAADLTVEGSGAIWVLDSLHSKVARLDRNCKVQRSFATKHPALAFQVNTAGELIVLTSAGEALFDLYDQNGNLLRSFGRRRSYGNPIADGELSSGRLVADRSGGFYFSFNYPPLVQHYARDGRLLDEFEPHSDIAIGPPNVSSQKQGNFIAVRSNYQILVLDMVLDEGGRLIFLLSGKPKYQALMEGSQTLLTTTTRGKVLNKTTIEDAAFHRLVAGHAALYLLRSRNGLRVDKYALP